MAVFVSRRKLIRWLWLAAVLSVSAPDTARGQDPGGAQLGPAPRITDPALWVSTATGRQAAALAPIDPQDRQAVVSLYNNTYLRALAVPAGWTGNASACNAGTTSAAYADATLDMVNYFRAMTRLPAALPHNPTKDAKSQLAALMMTANGSLSHSPPADWKCYSADGAEAAGKSNLALGAAGPAAVALYIRDPGSNNTALGHRRWVLYPRQTEMGTGSTGNANDLWVIGNFGTRPATPEFVAWPTAGFVPYPLVYARWSFSLNTDSSVDFTGATVSMSRGATPVSLTKLANANGYGDNTIAWEPSGLTFAAGMADEPITVDVSGVRVGGVSRDYRYTVTVIDPALSPCTFTVSPTAAAVGAAGGSGSLVVTASAASCAWTATVASGNDWLGLGAGGGTGSGPLTFTANPNSGGARTASVTVAGQSVTITQAATSPAVTYTLLLAEGATSGFFDTRLALLNPGSVGTVATLTFSRTDGSQVTSLVAVPARSRVTVDPKSIDGLASAEFSTAITADQLLVADRTMSWDAQSGYGAHAETAAAAASPAWYLAEGATHSGFDLFYLLQNPAATATTVRVRYLLPGGGTLEKSYRLPPTSRTNIHVDEEPFPGIGAALAATDVSAAIESTDGTPIIVERAMYLTSQGRFFNAGHDSLGVTAPATTWFLAEGATGPYFDLFVLIANPDPREAQVAVTYLLADGTTYARTLVAPANSRVSIHVDHEQFEGVSGLPLADVAVSTTVTSTNGVPIVVERAMWWPGTHLTWHEAHNSAGATATATRWALAEGEAGGPRAVETYILIANTSARAGTATVTVLCENGATATRTYTLPPNSRTNVPVAADFGATVQDQRFGAIVESTGGNPAQIVVERAMYWNAGGVRWAAGTNALATKLP
jgi:hypothetical protein